MQLRRGFATLGDKLPNGIPNAAKILLPRSLIAVHGEDSSKFLNGLLTRRPPDGVDWTTPGVFAAMLNAKGRVIADTFLYGAHDRSDIHASLMHSFDGSLCYLLDIDSTLVDKVMRILDFHILTSKVSIELLDSHEVLFEWNDELSIEAHPDFLSMDDTRAPGLGRRTVVPKDFAVSLRDQNNATQLDGLNVYNLRRYLIGIPEGANELMPAKALPLDYCMDYMGGIDFEKGCYVGQELTIRSHHHGTVRKRVVPVVFTGEGQDIPEDMYEPVEFGINSGESIIDNTPIPDEEKVSSIFAESPFKRTSSNSSEPATTRKPAGSVIASLGNVGLGMLRIDRFGHNFEVISSKENNDPKPVSVHALTPFWWPQSPTTIN